jgi:hypothetical protein
MRVAELLSRGGGGCHGGCLGSGEGEEWWESRETPGLMDGSFAVPRWNADNFTTFVEGRFSDATYAHRRSAPWWLSCGNLDQA